MTGTDRSGSDGGTGTDSSSRCQDPIPTASASGSADPTEPRFHEEGTLAFALPFPLGRSGKPLLVATGFVVLGAGLIVPWLVAIGYAYRVGRAAARGDATVPSCDDWLEAGKTGVVLVCVGLGVTVGLGAILAVAFGAAGPVGAVLAGVGAYVAGAVVPVAIGTGSVRGTFADRRLLAFACSRYYLKGGLLLVATTFALFFSYAAVTTPLYGTIGAISIGYPNAMIGAVPLFLLLIAVLTYAIVLSAALWGHVYNEAAAAGVVPAVDPDASLAFEWRS